MSPGLRRAALTVHVACSVGWLGAALAYVALNIPALGSSDKATVRAAYLMMEPVALYAVTPLAVRSLLTGVVQSLGTPWGLLRHYWVLISFAVTLFANVVLVLHLPAVTDLADRAAKPGTDVFALGGDLAHSLGGLLLLLLPLVLNIYKPRGLTRRGWRAQRRQHPVAPAEYGPAAG